MPMPIPIRICGAEANSASTIASAPRRRTRRNEREIASTRPTSPSTSPAGTYTNGSATTRPTSRLIADVDQLDRPDVEQPEVHDERDDRGDDEREDRHDRLGEEHPPEPLPGDRDGLRQPERATLHPPADDGRGERPRLDAGHDVADHRRERRQRDPAVDRRRRRRRVEQRVSRGRLEPEDRHERGHRRQHDEPDVERRQPEPRVAPEHEVERAPDERAGVGGDGQHLGRDAGPGRGRELGDRRRRHERPDEWVLIRVPGHARAQRRRRSRPAPAEVPGTHVPPVVAGAGASPTGRGGQACPGSGAAAASSSPSRSTATLPPERMTHTRSPERSGIAPVSDRGEGRRAGRLEDLLEAFDAEPEPGEDRRVVDQHDLLDVALDDAEGEVAGRRRAEPVGDADGRDGHRLPGRQAVGHRLGPHRLDAVDHAPTAGSP